MEKLLKIFPNKHVVAVATILVVAWLVVFVGIVVGAIIEYNK